MDITQQLLNMRPKDAPFSDYPVTHSVQLPAPVGAARDEMDLEAQKKGYDLEKERDEGAGCCRCVVM